MAKAEMMFPPRCAYGIHVTLHSTCYMLHSCYILLTDQISLSDCLHFSRYWAICILQLFVKQAVTS